MAAMVAEETHVGVEEVEVVDLMAAEGEEGTSTLGNGATCIPTLGFAETQLMFYLNSRCSKTRRL